MNIIFKDTFEQLVIGFVQIKPFFVSLIGFTGVPIMFIDSVRLYVSIEIFQLELPTRWNS